MAKKAKHTEVQGDKKEERLKELEKRLEQFSSLLGFTRGDLTNLIKRYYTYLGFETKESDGLLEIIKSTSQFPEFKYVFNRKDALNHRDAELVTYNNEKLLKLIENINKKGRIAKAFIPFTFDPNRSFEEALNNMLVKGNSSKNWYIANGNLEYKGHFITYIPFLVFIVKIMFTSLEAFSLIEKPIIPLVELSDPNAINEVEYFKKELKKYFDTLDPSLVSEMPVEGDIIEINASQFKARIKDTITDIETTVNDLQTIIKERMDETLKKEISIVENYYNQMIIEIDDKKQASISKSKKKTDKDKISEFNDEIIRLSKEKEFKINENLNIFKINTEYDIIGAALIYLPAMFYFDCNIVSLYGRINKKFSYDIFNKTLIPLRCSCGQEVYRGKICQNQHFTCIECSYKCAECDADICKECDINFCSDCNSALCAKHSYKCEECERKKKPNIWVCKDHLLKCQKCGSQLCHQCGVTCKICNIAICKEKRSCSIKCQICKDYVCLNHTFTCTSCSKSYCLNESVECSSCHRIYCKRDISKRSLNTCLTCEHASEEKFYMFRGSNNVQLTFPDYIKFSPYTNIVEIPCGNNIYSMPYNLTDVCFGENSSIYVFKFSTTIAKFTLVYDRQSKKEMLYRTPNILGKISDFFKNEKIFYKIEPNPAMLSFGKTALQSQSKLTCPKCNKTFLEDYNLCPYCGEKLVKDSK